MKEIVEVGKAVRLGISEATLDQVEKAHAIHPVSAMQSEMSLWTRDWIEAGVVGWCAEKGAAFVPYAPLGRGYLTGALSSREGFDENDFRARNPRFSREAMEGNRRIVKTVKAVAERLGATPAQVAIAWTLAQGEHVTLSPARRRCDAWRRTWRRLTSTCPRMPSPSSTRYRRPSPPATDNLGPPGSSSKGGLAESRQARSRDAPTGGPRTGCGAGGVPGDRRLPCGSRGGAGGRGGNRRRDHRTHAPEVPRHRPLGPHSHV